MRRVAESLDVGTMSLDRYVPGKAELLDLMLDRVRAPTRPSPASATTGAPRWRRWVRGMWRLYLRHPWLPFVDQSRPLLGPNSLDGFEFALHGLDDAGLTSQQKAMRSASSGPLSRRPRECTTTRSRPSNALV